VAAPDSSGASRADNLRVASFTENDDAMSIGAKINAPPSDVDNTKVDAKSGWIVST